MSWTAGREEKEGDKGVYRVVLEEELERIPLLDLRTRLVLWLLCLVFLGLVYWGVQSPTL